MKMITGIIILLVSTQLWANDMKNPLIDYIQFEKDVRTMAQDRENKRLNEADFIAAIESGNYILLDARSERAYKLRHIKGAINLPFTEFAESTLANVIPNKNTAILIYCNNNFLGSQDAFISKNAGASLNLSTQASLRN